ncbi:MAG: protein translocase subunit SecF [Acidobacteriota bacterium]|nr:protein translocase subunit SecF [Acidobacteriota bacterium]
MTTTERPNAFRRLFRGETSFDFAGRWRRWFAISGVVILAGVVSLGFRGLNFSIDFKGGTVWDVPTTASVATARSVIDAAVPGFGQSVVQQLTNTQTGQRTIQVEAAAKYVGDTATVQKVTDALANMAHVSPNDVQLNEIGPSWGSDITNKAIEAVIIFLVVVSLYIWLRFEGKMAIAALGALLHDILITAGIYSLSGFQVSPDTVIAFLTILGYSLYDTIVVFDRVQENTRGLASTNKLTYSDTVNLSMNQVLARSLNTSLVAILPILSILVIGSWLLGATALNDFGLALFVGLTTGAYSSIFIASPLLALMKEREPRYAEIRRRLDQGRPRKLTPASVAGLGPDVSDADLDSPATAWARRSGPPRPKRREAPAGGGDLPAEVEFGTPANGQDRPDAAVGEQAGIPLRRDVPPRSANRPPPRPRKKGRRR